MRFLSFLSVLLIPLSADAQGVMRLPVLCMDQETFENSAKGKFNESPLMYAETDGGGHMELWSSKDTYTLVYYPAGTELACVVSTGKELIPGVRPIGTPS